MTTNDKLIEELVQHYIELYHEEDNYDADAFEQKLSSLDEDEILELHKNVFEDEDVDYEDLFN